MNILIVGSGAREHAIAIALSRSAKQPRLFCCATSNNPGIQSLSQAYWVGNITHCDEVLKQALLWHINLAIIGPEAPLEKGLADVLQEAGILVVGPKKHLAQIETSKAFARNLMREYCIEGLPRYQTFSQLDGILEFLTQLGKENYVIKANGLMGGKGVKVAGDHLHSIEEALAYCKEIFEKKQTVVIEEKLVGQEFSLMCFCDGTSLVPMPLVQDHKRAFAEDKGPNTGGMGSYSTADHSLPFLKTADREAAIKINKEVLKALMIECREGFIGILYGGFIATAQGVFVIEFNARFGDPEALNVLSILESDFVELCCAMTMGTLKDHSIHFASKATVCKYAVPEGYPDNPVKDVVIDISDVADKSHLYLAAVHEHRNLLYATGSRTAAYVGVADYLEAAEEIAEKEISRIKGPLFHRKDIGTHRLIEKRVNEMHRLRSLW